MLQGASPAPGGGHEAPRPPCLLLPEGTLRYRAGGRSSNREAAFPGCLFCTLSVPALSSAMTPGRLLRGSAPSERNHRPWEEDPAAPQVLGAADPPAEHI